MAGAKLLCFGKSEVTMSGKKLIVCREEVIRARLGLYFINIYHTLHWKKWIWVKAGQTVPNITRVEASSFFTFPRQQVLYSILIIN